jgi:hypothetical protein
MAARGGEFNMRKSLTRSARADRSEMPALSGPAKREQGTAAVRICSPNAMAYGDEPRMQDDASRRATAIADRGGGKVAA